MHSTETPNGTVPAFLTKLWRLVEDKKYDDLICWSQNGQSFIIHQQSKFAKDILPLYFKHNNMASFIRQLNMYGFRKVVNLEQGRLSSENDIEFFHQFFVQGREVLLAFIKRKVPVTRGSGALSEEANVKPEMVSEMLSDVQALKGKQESVDNLLGNMKRENEALWREVAFLRQKHMKQQQIVEKLIQFLVTLVQPNGVNIGVVKRKVPLMLYNNSPGVGATEAKMPRISRQISSTIGNPGTSTGPVIHDVTDALDPKPLFSNEALDDKLLNDPVLAPEEFPTENQPLIDSPAMIPSPLGTDDVMEPLSLLVPLETPTQFESVSPHADQSESFSETLFLRDTPTVEKRAEQESLDTPIDPIDQLDFTKETPQEAMTLFSEDNKMQVALSDSKYRKGNTPLERNHLNEHLEGIESELDWLQEQISGSSLNFDVSGLLSLFGADDTVPGNNLPADSMKFTSGEVAGNEVVQYNFANLPDLIEESNEASQSTLGELLLGTSNNDETKKS